MRVLFFIVLHIVLLTVSAQEITPYFRNFSKTDYKGENPNWNISQNSEGVIYSANNHNLLEFNGSFWYKYQLPEPSDIRSVSVINDTIFTGAYEGFGYWLKDETNVLQYYSLSKNLKKTYFDNNQIWKIIPFSNDIIFQSFQNFFLFNRKTKNIKVIANPLNISAIFCYSLNGEIYLTTRHNGLYKLMNDRFVFLSWSEPLKNTSVQSLVEFDKGILIATEFNGFFYYKKGVLKKWKLENEKQLEKIQINNVSVLDDNICVGTTNSGLLVYDTKGHLKYTLNKKNGLLNNTILSQFIDNDHNLWLGLDRGISVLCLKSPIQTFTDYSGILGSVFDMVKSPKTDDYIIGTNHGLFKLKNDSNLEFIKNSNGQVWDLTVIDNQIICGHNVGTYILEDDNLIKISDFSGGRAFKKLPNAENKYIQANYNGLTFYEKHNNSWTHKQVSEIDFHTKNMEFDNNELWLSSTYKGFFRIHFSDDSLKIRDINVFNKNHKAANLFSFNNNIFFSRENELYRYDNPTDSILRYKLLEDKLTPFDELQVVENMQVLLAKYKDNLKIFDLQNKKEFAFNSKIAASRLVSGYPNAKQIDDHFYMYLDDGFLKVNQSVFDYKSNLKVPVFSRVYSDGEALNPKIKAEIPNKKNNIQFEFSANQPITLSAVKYKYKLDNYDENWEEVIENQQVKYNNLPYGSYVFRVKTHSNGKESPEAIYKFKILTPWFLNIWMLLLYVSLFVLVFYGIYKFNRSKFYKKKQLLKKELAYQNQLKIQQETIEKDKQISKLEQEKLKNRLKYKSRELASHAITLERKDKILSKIKQLLNRYQDDSQLYKRLTGIVDSLGDLSEERFLFESSFNELHEDFFTKLERKYPILTIKDLKLCAYIKMNLSSKEIAPLLGITFRSVELHRYRLRKKLDLPKDQNLVKFLLNF